MSLTSEEISRLIDRFWESVPPAWKTVRGNLRAAATDQFGVSVAQFHVLRHIRKGIRSISGLAAELGVSRPAVSQAVDGLVGRGLVARVQDANDRRYVQLDLTPAGNELLNGIFTHNRAWMAQRFGALTAQEREVLMQAFEILKMKLE